MKKVYFFFLFFFTVNFIAAQQKDKPEVKLPGTQILNIHSSITDKDYDLYVSLPQHYNDTGKTFPVLYVLDAQWDYPLGYSIYGELYYDGMVSGLVQY